MPRTPSGSVIRSTGTTWGAGASPMDTLRASASTPRASTRTCSTSARITAHRASLIASSGDALNRAIWADMTRKSACVRRSGPRPSRERASMKASTSSLVRHAASSACPGRGEGCLRSPSIRKVPAYTAVSVSSRVDQLACSMAESSMRRAGRASAPVWPAAASDAAAALADQVRTGRASRASIGRSRKRARSSSGLQFAVDVQPDPGLLDHVPAAEVARPDRDIGHDVGVLLGRPAVHQGCP